MKRYRRFLAVAVLGLAFLAGSFLLLRSTRAGMGYSPDSVSYLALAEGIAAGKGFVDVRSYDSPAVPIYPPGYSFLLALGGIGEEDLMSSIRRTHAILFGLNAFLVGLILLRYSGSLLLTLLGSVLFLSCDSAIPIHAMVWSEAFFVTCTLLFVATMASYLEDPRGKQIVWPALFAAMSAITRFPGVAAIAGGGLLLLSRKAPWRRRLRDGLVFAGISALPLSLWLIRNVLTTGDAYLGDRGPSKYAFSLENLYRGLDILKGWTGKPAGSYVACLALIFVGLFLINAFHSTVQRPRSPRPMVLAALGLIVPYTLVMTAATYAYGLHKPLDSRALLPIYGPTLWLALLTCYFFVTRYLPAKIGPLSIGRKAARRWRFLGRGIATTGLGVFLFLAVEAALDLSDPAIVRGVFQRKQLEVVEAMRTIEPPGVVVSNIDDLLYVKTRQRAYRLPQLYHRDTREVRLPGYEEKMEWLREVLGDDGMIVYHSPTWRRYLPSEEELLEQLPLEVVIETSDGTIYRIRKR